MSRLAPRFPMTLYFDGSCPLCSAEMRKLRARDLHKRLRFVDCSPADFSAGPAPRTALMDAIHAVDAQGHVFVGVPALRAAYVAVGLRVVDSLLALPGLRHLADRAYAVLARNRRRLPAWLSDPLATPFTEGEAERAARRTQACREDMCERPAKAARPDPQRH